VLVAREHLADHHVGQRWHPGADDLLDLKTEERDRMSDLIDGGVEGHVGFEPVEGDFHRKVASSG
jgi:hypothetical protein